MFERFRALRTHLEDYDLDFVAQVPVSLHSHHFHLFWDQTIDDVLGKAGIITRTHAAREAFHDLLEQLVVKLDVETPRDRLELASEAYAAFGLGRIILDVTRDGGLASAEQIHHGRGWLQKYGHRIRRRAPVDALTAGFAAAATEVAYDLPRESIEAEERECIATLDRRCAIHLRPGALAPRKGSVLYDRYEGVVGPQREGLYEDKIVEVARGLRAFAGGIHGDERGLAEVFGLLLARCPSTALFRAAAEAYQQARSVSADTAALTRALFREASHADTFYTVGGLLSAPEWETIVGSEPSEVEDVIWGGVAIVRAFGGGHWCIEKIDPGREVVIHTPSTPESAYWMLREDKPSEGICHSTQGAVLGLTQLAHRVPWQERPEIGPELYDAWYRAGPSWRIEEPRCLAKGDPYCELIARRLDR
jgi:hypothetical protein